MSCRVGDGATTASHINHPVSIYVRHRPSYGHSMAEDDDSEAERARVLKALRETGYPLELRVAAALRSSPRSPYYVNQSRHYVDPVTGKLREADVIACWRVASGAHVVFAYLVIECKSKPWPWVVFDADEGLTGRPRDLLESLYLDEIPQGGRLSKRLDDRWLKVDRTLLEPVRLGHAVVDSKIAKADDNDVNHDAAYKAVQAAMSAVRGFSADTDREELEATGKEIDVVVIPAVVTGGSLYRGWLDASNDVDVEAVDLAWVALRADEEPRLRRCAVAR